MTNGFKRWHSPKNAGKKRLETLKVQTPVLRMLAEGYVLKLPGKWAIFSEPETGKSLYQVQQRIFRNLLERKLIEADGDAFKLTELGQWLAARTLA